MIRNSMRKHPNADRPVIDWHFISLMQPMLIAGAVVGSTLNKIIPGLVLAVLLFIILCFTAVRTFQNGNRKWARENVAREKLAEGGTRAASTEAAGIEMEAPEEASKDAVSPELEALLREDSGVPWSKVLIVVSVFVMILALNIARGSEDGKFNPVGVVCGSHVYWWLTLGVVPFCLACWFLVRAMTVTQHIQRREAGWPYIEGDVAWDEDMTLRYPCVAILSGLIAGMFGIGGGLINGPLMVELGFNPEVAAATGAAMLLLTSTTSTMMYTLFDLLDFSYAVVLVPIGFVSTFTGQFLFNKAMAHYKRDSLIIYVIAFIVGASAVMMGIVGAAIAWSYEQGTQHKPGGVCEAGTEINFPPVLGAFIVIIIMWVTIYAVRFYLVKTKNTAQLMAQGKDPNLEKPAVGGTGVQANPAYGMDLEKEDAEADANVVEVEVEPMEVEPVPDDDDDDNEPAE